MQTISQAINYFIPENDTSTHFKQLTDSKIIQINNDLDGILSDMGKVNNTKITLPNIVVVGGQSSGKSSVLNGIITMPILPTGKEMVTRTPLCIQLTTSDHNKLEFGDYINTRWQMSKTINFQATIPTSDELDTIRQEIERLTIVKAGTGKNISFNKITIKIYSKYVPNLTLVDLPGLTMVACTDKGQPKDIKEQIENMVSEYIKKPETIILAVIPARSDIEADIAMGLVKKYDERGQRTIGVLTKVDLMNKDTHVGNYITQDISKDLQLKYGYYLIRNRSNTEMKSFSVLEGFDKEKEYFKSHPFYGKLNSNLQSRTNIGNLRNSLTSILVQTIKAYLPRIMTEVDELLITVDKQLIDMGGAIPNDIADKTSMLHLLTADFCRKFVDVLDERHSSMNVGRNIKETFIIFKKNIGNINPFTEKECPSSYITNAMKNCEGNHMPCLLPPIEVLEYCLTDVNKRPICSLKPLSMKCVDDIMCLLRNLVNTLLAEDCFARFPKLTLEIKKCIDNNILTPYSFISSQRIDELISQEESYIWTDCKDFTNALGSILKSKGGSYGDLNADLNAENLRTLLHTYFSTVINTLQNSVPKTIMYHLIKKMSRDISSVLFTHIAVQNNICLLEESSNIANKRIQFTMYKNKLSYAKQLIEK